MAPPDTKNLRMSGLQWQYRKKLPKALAQKRDKKWLVKNLGRITLGEAIRKRDRLNVELADELAGVDASEAQLLMDFKSADSQQQKILEHVYSNIADDKWQAADKAGDYSGRQEAAQFYKRVTGQHVPIELNLKSWQQQSSAVEASQVARTATLSRFIRWAPVKHVHEVDRRLAGQYVDQLVAEGLAQKTINNLVSCLSAYWRFLMKKDIAASNPFEKQALAGKVQQRREAWSLDQIRLLIDKAPNDLLRDAILVAALMGLRAGELAGLKVADCEGGLCRITSGKTESSTRELPWHSQLTTCIAKRLIAKHRDDFLFHELNGKPQALSQKFTIYRNQLFPKLRPEVGKQSPWTLHGLRHSWITERMRAECNESQVKELAGHKRSGVTMSVYHHGMSLEQKKKVVEAVHL